MAAALIVGDRFDVHVEAVIDRLRTRGATAVAIDATSLSRHRWRYDNQGFSVLNDDDQWIRPRRAWLRRLARAGDHRGMRLGSRRAAEASARLALLAALDD